MNELLSGLKYRKEEIKNVFSKKRINKAYVEAMGKNDIQYAWRSVVP
jgi:hypothetical protein